MEHHRLKTLRKQIIDHEDKDEAAKSDDSIAGIFLKIGQFPLSGEDFEVDDAWDHETHGGVADSGDDVVHHVQRDTIFDDDKEEDHDACLECDGDFLVVGGDFVDGHVLEDFVVFACRNDFEVRFFDLGCVFEILNLDL